MGSSGFFKGEKKKPKKGKEKNIQFSQPGSSAPTYTMPEVISKKKQQG